MDIYKISSTGLSVNYMPQYVAEKLGYFSDVDLKVETSIPSPWPKVLKDIDSGTHHAVCGGIWVPSMYISHGVQEYSAFAKISSRCPYKLVSRDYIENFKWKDLENKTILIPCDGGASAYIYLVGKLKDEGVDISTIRFVHDFIESMIVECFSLGTMGDFVFVTPVAADSLFDSKKGHIVSEMAKTGGEVPWSVYYSIIDVAKDERNLNGRFALAIQRGLEWMNTHKGDDCRDILKTNWPQMDINTAIDTIDRFIEDGMWANTIEIGVKEYENYARYQVDAGIIDKILPYDRIVDISTFNYVKTTLKL